MHSFRSSLSYILSIHPPFGRFGRSRDLTISWLQTQTQFGPIRLNQTKSLYRSTKLLIRFSPSRFSFLSDYLIVGPKTLFSVSSDVYSSSPNQPERWRQFTDSRRWYIVFSTIRDAGCLEHLGCFRVYIAVGVSSFCRFCFCGSVSGMGVV